MLATNLRNFRTARGLTQEQLARKAKVHRLTIVRIENGASPEPRLTTLRQLGKALGVDYSLLLAGRAA